MTGGAVHAPLLGRISMQVRAVVVQRGRLVLVRLRRRSDRLRRGGD